jgi:transcriptional regulator with XRE-family HTH domain
MAWPVETISNIERGASWTSLEMLENLSKLFDERVEVFFEGYVRAKRKSQTRIQLEADPLPWVPGIERSSDL